MGVIIAKGQSAPLCHLKILGTKFGRDPDFLQLSFNRNLERLSDTGVVAEYPRKIALDRTHLFVLKVGSKTGRFNIRPFRFSTFGHPNYGERLNAVFAALCNN